MTDRTSSTPCAGGPTGRWTRSPAWTLLLQPHEGRTLLVLTGGADETYIVDEADADDVAGRVYEAWQADNLEPLLDDPACGAAARQIRRVGALVPAAAARRPATYALAWLGTPWPALADALDGLAGEHGLPPRSDRAKDAGLLLLVRTDAGWRQALDAYAALRPGAPHLFVDAAYHHTLGVGPYVVPGQTACVACLGNRVARRWGDPPMPPRPAVSARPRGAAALLAPILAAPVALAGFIEHSASLDLQTLAGTRDKVFQLPWCPVCGQGHERAGGALALPWLASRQEDAAVQGGPGQAVPAQEAAALRNAPVQAPSIQAAPAPAAARGVSE
ncbi:hypothetical protein [Bordetella genomosp. 13]|uniref:hypothetical protein n=1 Tax=Bordetella genomosp. 13 TaxID=463040 RepID=UPI0016426045|nr:hypothetical protein [Bordetella genomosp. 13]